MNLSRMVGVGIAVVLILWGGAVSAAHDRVVMVGHFEGGSELGRFEYENSADGAGLLINYYSPSVKKNFTYHVVKFDECSILAMYQLPFVNQVVIDGSCFGTGGQVHEYVYEWSSKKGNWCLIRAVSGEKADVAAGVLVPSEQVSRVAGCPFIGEEGEYAYRSRAEVARNIVVELREFRNSVNDRQRLKRYIDMLPSYGVSELSDYIDMKNVRDINDIAFYLSEADRFDDAMVLLEKIVRNFPGRVVAKLNLADVYWQVGYRQQGIGLYVKYRDEMFAAGRGEKIPGRVFDRLSAYKARMSS
ncbi:tetratricopeptide repeat protein [Burkholderia sp. 3C]